MKEKDTVVVDPNPANDGGTLPPLKLNVKRTFKVGFAFLLIQIFWTVYNLLMGPLLVNDFGLNQTWSGVVLALDNVVALILLPIFGAWSDKTSTKRGKRTPFIVVGTIIAIVFFIALGVVDHFQQQEIINQSISGVLRNEESGLYYFTQHGEIVFSDLQKELVTTQRSALVLDIVTGQYIGYLIAFILVLLVVLIAMSAFRSPAVSLMPDVTPKPLRSQANAIINMMGALGLILANVAYLLLAKDYQSYVPLFLATAGMMLLCLAIFLATVKEKEWGQEMTRVSLLYGIEEEEEIEAESKHKKMDPAVRRSMIFLLVSIFLWFMGYNAASSKYSVYASAVLDMTTTEYTIAMLAAGLAAVVVYWPVAKISTKLGRKKTIYIGLAILLAGMITGIFVNINSSWLMYVAMITVGIGWATVNVNSYPMVVEMSHGTNIGVYTGYYYSASMAAQIVTPILSGVFMDLWGMQYVLFTYSAIFVLLSAVTMIFVKHGDAKKLTELTKLDAE